MPSWIDLTQPFCPTTPGFEAEAAKNIEQDGWNAQTLHIYSHAGTHMDAPYHFGMGPTYIDDIPPSRFAGRTWKVSLPQEAPSALLEADEVVDQLPDWQPGDNLLIETGWSRYQETDWDLYRNGLPRISPSLAHWCVAQRVNLLGVEPPSVADVNALPELTQIHQILLGGGVLIVEGLCRLNLLPHGPFQLFAFPLNIHQGDGAPARVIALING